MSEVAPAGAEPPGTAEARELARRLEALEEGPVRAGAAARALAALPPAGVVDLLAALSRRSDPGARAALVAIGGALAGPGAPLLHDHLAEVYAIAAEAGRLEVMGLLLAPPPLRAWVAPRDRADPRLEHLSLGHRKAIARTHRDPDLLARLAAEGEPRVVRELLRNPLLTEPFILRFASRRPARPESLRLLAESARWRTRPAVIRAILSNPWAEPAVGLRLLPLLPATDLDGLAGDGAIHPFLRAIATRLASRRRGG